MTMNMEEDSDFTMMQADAARTDINERIYVP
jgi:hypothetical protein